MLATMSGVTCRVVPGSYGSVLLVIGTTVVGVVTNRGRVLWTDVFVPGRAVGGYVMADGERIYGVRVE